MCAQIKHKHHTTFVEVETKLTPTGGPPTGRVLLLLLLLVVVDLAMSIFAGHNHVLGYLLVVLLCSLAGHSAVAARGRQL